MRKLIVEKPTYLGKKEKDWSGNLDLNNVQCNAFFFFVLISVF